MLTTRKSLRKQSWAQTFFSEFTLLNFQSSPMLRLYHFNYAPSVASGDT
jgi:hypothetical protein